MEPIKVLDFGYIRLIEVWGKGDAGLAEAGIIEAARQSTQGNFRGGESYDLREKCGAFYGPSDGYNTPEGCPDGLGHEWKIRQYAEALETILKEQFPKTYGLFEASRDKAKSD